MKRRAFLAWLTSTAAGVAAASTLDVDQLLYVPGARTIFLPPAPAIDRVQCVLTSSGSALFVPIEETWSSPGPSALVSGRFVVTTQARGETTRVTYSDRWEALTGLTYGRQPEAWSGDELAMLSSALRAADSREARRSLPAWPVLDEEPPWPRPARFVETIHGERYRAPGDAVSRPGEILAQWHNLQPAKGGRS